jgi:hypothetical protein
MGLEVNAGSRLRSLTASPRQHGEVPENAKMAIDGRERRNEL